MRKGTRVVEVKKCDDCDGFGVKIGNDFMQKWKNGVEEAVAKMVAGCSCPPLDVLLNKLTDGKPKCLACKGRGIWIEEAE